MGGNLINILTSLIQVKFWMFDNSFFFWSCAAKPRQHQPKMGCIKEISDDNNVYSLVKTEFTTLRSELDNLGKTAAACKTKINDCVLEMESSTAK